MFIIAKFIVAYALSSRHNTCGGSRPRLSGGPGVSGRSFSRPRWIPPPRFSILGGSRSWVVIDFGWHSASSAAI